MHTDALYRTAHGHQLSASCSGLHTYRMVVFLLTFLFTLVIITVSFLRHEVIWRWAEFHTKEVELSCELLIQSIDVKKEISDEHLTSPDLT